MLCIVILYVEIKVHCESVLSLDNGQNDIKKLRKENEQLRKEIWCLRDEYDKLEEILKRQKNLEESDVYEERSGEDEELQSDYSYEEDEDEIEEEDAGEHNEKGKVIDDFNEEERLDNAENQKISSEKMNNVNPRRMHVEFDDLSVVDEEEELKKERERKDNNVSPKEVDHSPPQHFSILPMRMGSYDPSNIYNPNLPNYYADYPYEIPPSMDPLHPSSAVMNCPRLFADSMMQTLDSPNLSEICPPVGWQNDVVPPSTNLLQRRNIFFKHPIKIPEPTTTTTTTTATAATTATTTNATTVPDKPKHFFAPLPSKLRFPDSPTTSYFGTGTSCSSDKTVSTLVSRMNTMTTNDFMSDYGKGSMDVCVNGAIPCENDQRTFLSTGDLLIQEDEGKQSMVYSRNGSQPIVKSLSCQDLTSEMMIQSPMISEQFSTQMLTKSDNTLENSSSSTSQTQKPYRSHLNVTLKVPKDSTTIPRPSSPGTPEIPKLPTIDYKIFTNPFLRNFDKTCPMYPASPSITTPLSVQVNNSENNLTIPPATVTAYPRNNPTIPGPTLPSIEQNYCRNTDLNHRLLIPKDQLMNNHSVLSPHNKLEDIQITSFEKPSPHNLIPPPTSYDLRNLRRLATNRYLQSQNLYQNIPPRTILGHTCSPLTCGPTTMPLKVPAQTQTSFDGDSHQDEEEEEDDDDDEGEEEKKGPNEGRHRSNNQTSKTKDRNSSAPCSPTTQRRRRLVRKEKTSSSNNSPAPPTPPASGVNKESSRPLSPAAQRRLLLRKQNSVTTSSEAPESPSQLKLLQLTRPKSRKLSVTTTTTSDPGQEDKNESRSSSSGQDSPRKDQNRRVPPGLYFNAKKRPSLTSSIKTTRSGSLELSKDKYLRDAIDGQVTNSERERTNSVSSREIPGSNNNVKKRKDSSESGGNVPWCACWGNGCF